jgi:hypothetical protein
MRGHRGNNRKKRSHSLWDIRPQIFSINALIKLKQLFRKIVLKTIDRCFIPGAEISYGRFEDGLIVVFVLGPVEQGNDMPEVCFGHFIRFYKFLLKG